MADTFTPHLNLVLPEIGASRSTWGSKLNANTQAVDAYLYARNPPGSLMDFAGNTPPDGWLPCDGRAISRVDYGALFAVIGTAWGAGDGSTSFNIPDLRGRITIGTGTGTDSSGIARGFGLAQKFGQWVVQLFAGNLPNISVVGVGDHVHSAWTDTQGAHAHGGGTSAVGDHTHAAPTPGTNSNGAGGSANFSGAPGFNGYGTGGGGAHGHTIATDVQGAHGHNVGIGGAGTHTHALGGGDAAHENTPPVTGVTKMIFTGKVSVTTVTVNTASLDVLHGHAI